jgi:uncharacterized membrane protein
MKHSLRFVWQDIKRNIVPYINDIISMSDGTDFDGTINSIKSSTSIRGAEIWLLVCSVILISVGLDINSSAIIIAGILICPILKPTIGLGLGFGIGDRDMIFSSLKNLASIIIVIFISSALYFLLSPLGHQTNELLLRAKPILLDVLVAFFGGIAIIINYSRQQKSIAFPRVIIGFMIIPPICTSAFGLVHTDPKYYFGAIYLLVLNLFFISLAIYLISRYLNFPSHYSIDPQRKKKFQRSILAVAILLILPSSYILYDVVVQTKIDKTIQKYIAKYITNDNYESIRWEIEENPDHNIVKVFVVGAIMDTNKINQLERDFNKYYLDNFKLRIIQMHVTESEKIQLKQELAGEVETNVLKQLQSAQFEKQISREKIDSLQRVMKELYLNKSLLNDIKNEVEIVFPELDNVRFGLLGTDIIDSADRTLLPVAYIDFKNNINRKVKLAISDRISNYLQLKFKRDTVKVVFDLIL